ncbi:lipocalin family protein [Sphingomonas psychrotolerans]|uniref:Outer membrane lipoprotein Blc n=1 Tax=Sphingomonas psychrotolerans TaxID=1327635 RepID=A0ABU3N8Y2_9SPHN|nr:lipocalin family protein [Sphingomonas psychrotolerans]MDT8760954.1 lipocalin family protein [Sphingomonas psychrotolerans]
MKQSTAITIATGVAAAAIGGIFVYSRATRPPVINARVPEPTKPVELARYLGKWFEIARHENRFQKGLDAVTAEYTLREDGKIGIVNSGSQSGPRGARSAVEGRAIIVDETTNAKLKVSFFGPLYTGDYWVLDHGDDYEWSIVGEPSGRYLWILSREAKPAPAAAEALLKRVEALGYDRWGLRITRQG